MEQNVDGKQFIEMLENYRDYIDKYFLMDKDDLVNLFEKCESFEDVVDEATEVDNFCRIDWKYKKIERLIDIFRERSYERGDTAATTPDEFVEELQAAQFDLWKIMRSDEIGQIMKKKPSGSWSEIMGLCDICNGSGEGLTDGSICFKCKGKGVPNIEEI